MNLSFMFRKNSLSFLIQYTALAPFWGWSAGTLQAKPAAKAPEKVLKPVGSLAADEGSDTVFPITVEDSDPIRYSEIPSGNPEQCTSATCEITVVEYADYQCPFCQRGQATAQQLLNDYRGRIRWIVRDFPLPGHSQAKPAAVAAHCAKDQGKYWEMHDAIFRNQNDLTNGKLQELGVNVGLNMERFGDCLENPQRQERVIASNVSSAMKLGVLGTPTYFVNGHRLVGALPVEDFKSVIEAELAQ